MENNLSKEEIRLRCLEVAAKTAKGFVYDKSASIDEDGSEKITDQHTSGNPIELNCKGRVIQNMFAEYTISAKEELFKRADEMVEYVMGIRPSPKP